jgi:fructokinase
LDVNLRQQFYDRAVLDESCRRATIVKLNEDELPLVADLLSLPAGAPIARLAQLRAAYNLAAVVYTRGKQGTLLVTADQMISPPAVSYPAALDADAVGAGDACTAGILVGWLLEKPVEEIALLANHLGAYVASQPGGTPQLPAEIIAIVE